VADGVVLKIVPCTDRVWNMCLEEGIIEIFKDARAMVSNPGCAGCAAGQVGQNGPGEVSVSSGNRNFPGKQGMGDVYLASPEVAAASAVSGLITSPDQIHTGPVVRESSPSRATRKREPVRTGRNERPVEFTGRTWLIPQDDIDTDMIYHNRHLAITDIGEMGQHAFGNLKGYESFASEAREGDIIFTGKNFGAGSSRQQAVDCFTSLGVGCIVAASFGSIYERNAINAAFPILVAAGIDGLELKAGDRVSVDISTGKIINLSKRKSIQANPFSEVQMEIYQNGGLF
jgi:3-isopropylmalate dehydratase small subunit